MDMESNVLEVDNIPLVMSCSPAVLVQTQIVSDRAQPVAVIWIRSSIKMMTAGVGS